MGVCVLELVVLCAVVWCAVSVLDEKCLSPRWRSGQCGNATTVLTVTVGWFSAGSSVVHSSLCVDVVVCTECSAEVQPQAVISTYVTYARPAQPPYNSTLC